MGESHVKPLMSKQLNSWDDVDGVISLHLRSAALAGIAGVLLLGYYNTISPTMGITVGFKSLRCGCTWWYQAEAARMNHAKA